MTTVQEALKTVFPTLAFEFDKQLGPLTYFKIGGKAEAYIDIKDKLALIELVRFCQHEHIRFTMIGGASNVIIADKGLSGLVIQYTNDQVIDTKEQSETDSAIYKIRIASGIKMALLVSRVVSLGYEGLEYFLGVPGTLGGAIYNNSHYLSDLIGEYVLRVEVIEPSGVITWLSQEECQFGYDSSRFHHTKEVILTVEFGLKRGTKEASQKKIVEATKYRAQTQPLGPPSSGCIFQNVPNTPRLKQLFPQFAQKALVPGGFIIDQAGLKGTRFGGVEVSQKHAAWFINTGSATAADVKELIKIVKARVKQQFDVDLREEVFYLE